MTTSSKDNLIKVFESYEKVKDIFIKPVDQWNSDEKLKATIFFADITQPLHGIKSISTEDKERFNALVWPTNMQNHIKTSIEKIKALNKTTDNDRESVSGGSGQPDPTNSESNTELKNGRKPDPSTFSRDTRRTPYGTNAVLDIDTLFSVDPNTNVFVLPPNSNFKVSEATPPGVMSRQQLKMLSPTITNLCNDVWGSTESKYISATMVGIGQVLVMAMTSMNTKADDVEPAVITMDGKEGVFTYGRVRESITNPFSGTPMPNALRRFMRAISPSIVYWLTSGMIKPNLKLMSKWGVPPAFYPYVVDGVIPDAGRDGLSAVLAKMMASTIALKQAQNLSSKTIHNALEQSSGGLGVLEKL
uniref:p39 n=1 Tax=Little cherry virus 2 TaxID=154339 RepID=A0A290D8C4_9CLOS|nr:p39 protein [Little cherry virus 2]BCA25909.1 p39 [Little cherry virus 2]